MGRFFNPPFGDLEITPFYANNEMFAQELRFSVPAGEWSEFEKSPLFQAITEYVERVKTQYTQTEHRQPEYKEENEALLLHSMLQDYPEPFWVRVRKWFLGKRFR